MASNALTEQPGKADAKDDDNKKKSVAERKKEANDLKPVRNDPDAATSTADFVSQDEDIEDYGEEDEVEEKPAKSKK